MTEYSEIPEAKDFKTVGKILRKKREEHSYTLEHVAEITRITITSLRNIEAGDLSQLPDIVFVRGFVRNYANLLGIESDWMVQVLNQTQNPIEEPPNEYETSASSFDLKSLLSEKNYLALGGVLLALLLLIVLINLGGENKPEQVQVIEAIEQVSNSQAAKTTKENSSPATIPNVLSPLNLALLAQKNDWVNLTVDGKTVHQVRLEKGKKYEWPAQEGYELTMTTGASAKVYINGEEIEVSKDQKEDLYEAKLNKFSLTQLNNQVR